MRHSGCPQPFGFFAIGSFAAYDRPQWHRPANRALIVPVDRPLRDAPPPVRAFAPPACPESPVRPLVDRAGAGTGKAAAPCAVPAGSSG
ncbi:hypothetical protein SCALM49S_02615 [Streptomyces californicus]